MESTSKFTIREARLGETALLRDFQVAMAIESEGFKLDPEVCLRGVRRIFEEPSLGQYLFLEEAGSVIGCVLLQREWSDWRARMILWIHSLYVRPEFRGKGAYRALYTSLQERVKNDPALGGLRLYVDRGNLSAAAAYEKLGMTREHYHLYEWMK
jgi:ribosomal protein S18 acetylase RimI-like enzyme